jgi:hypothetical protein
MLNVVRLNVFRLNAVMLNVVRLNVVRLSVVAPMASLSRIEKIPHKKTVKNDKE